MSQTPGPAPGPDPSGPADQRLPRALRLSGRRAFAAVFAARTRKSRGPLAVWARPNGLGHARLGLSLARTVGAAVVRNRIKRLLRDAFRLHRRQWPAGYDWVVVVYRHPPLKLPDYCRLLAEATAAAAAEWDRRGARGKGQGARGEG